MEATEVVTPKWNNWCRLCAVDNGCQVDCLVKDESVTINLLGEICKYFSVQITESDVAPKMICKSCSKFIADIVIYSDQCSKVQDMFKELLDNEQFNATEADFDSLRTKFGVIDSRTIESPKKLPKRRAKSTRRSSAEDVPLERPEVEYLDVDCIDVKNIKMEQSCIEEDTIIAFDDDNDDSEADPDVELGNENDDNEAQSSSDDDENLKTKIKKGLTKIKKRKKTENCKYNCEQCNRGFILEQNFRSHMKRAHEIIITPPVFSCTNCDKSFATEKRLENHQYCHLPAHMKLSLPCSMCDKIFTRQLNLKAHIKQVHNEDKPFICEECGKAFKTHSYMRDHQITHMTDSPYKCSHCEKSFKNMARLKLHEDTHNATAYVCTICGTQLNTKRTLRMHMLVHSEQKQFKCDFCGNEFKRAKALKNHLILHTGLKPYRCTFCDKTFANGSNCRSHKRKSHPIELAAFEAAGAKSCVKNMPKLDYLRAVTSVKPLPANFPIPSSSQSQPIEQPANYMETISVNSTPVHTTEEQNQVFGRSIFDSLPMGS